MGDDIETIRELYARFNARDIDGVLAALAEDVAWANGMEGGHVHGRQAVRDYWTRQWSMVSPQVEPLRLVRTADGEVRATVRQTIRDLEGRPMQDPDFGLQDKTVGHIFRLRGGEVVRFDIGEPPSL